MGWRFRKVFRFGPIQSTISKKGVGWSIGISGFRYGLAANGHRHISIGIPGTGFYWYKDLDSNTAQHQQILYDLQHNPLNSRSNISVNSKVTEPWWKQKGLED